jgi:hypothetical protein
MSEREIPEGREIVNVGTLDLTTIQSADDLAGIERIRNVGLILVPEQLAHLIARIPMKNVGGVLPVPAGEKVKVLAGNLKMSGDALASPTGDEETLVVAGMLHLTSPVERVTYKRLIVAGMVLAPVGSEEALGAGLTRLAGNIVYYQGNPRIFSGRDQLSREFFEYLDPGQSLIFSGHVTIEDDVTPELLRQKVTSIVVSGKVEAPRALIPVLQFLATEKSGVIVPSDESDD